MCYCFKSIRVVLIKEEKENARYWQGKLSPSAFLSGITQCICNRKQGSSSSNTRKTEYPNVSHSTAKYVYKRMGTRTQNSYLQKNCVGNSITHNSQKMN